MNILSFCEPLIRNTSSGAAQPFLGGFKVKNPAVCTNYPDV